MEDLDKDIPFIQFCKERLPRLKLEYPSEVFKGLTQLLAQEYRNYRRYQASLTDESGKIMEQQTRAIAEAKVQQARSAAVQQIRAAAEITAQQAADELWQEEEACESAAGGGGKKIKSKSNRKSKVSDKGKK